MGAKHFFVAALAALGSTGAVAAQAAASEPIKSAQGPKPGALETFRDWTIGCDNRNRCEAVSLLPEGGVWPDSPIMVGVVRDAGPDAAAEVWVSRDGKGGGEFSFHVDGRRIASAMSREGDATLRGPQASALAIAMARGGTLEIRSGNRSLGKPSLAGSGAALRYMDARQGRAGTSTALVATGAMGPIAVRAAPVAPTIRRAPLPGTSAPVALWREELTAIGKFTGCANEMKGAEPPQLYRLSKSETLILVPCGSGAYNFTAIPVIATGDPGRRAFRLAGFDMKPGWSEEESRPMLVNAGWTQEKLRLDSFAKGRGLGDCGGSEAYVWDGTRFRLIEATSMGECRGAWHWIRTWSAQVTD
ncbi:hypothetical protein ASE85_05215 [Sphingobium sp. Leaf26]|uniref:DUF1176 domain-containing protein n=1 Tax=Sphingobium sp. Leaf26 TaxID=1735693 RepID=UPI0006F98CEE|nr:DUF1176 domain-containing protein [Sphingobium sp. Leaf26]KQN04441.1 hypothetical protein ASE85_05215 [Sphingobium sp. Leaf26]